MDDHEEAYEKVLRCGGEIRQYLDKEELFKTLPTDAQAFLLVTKAMVEPFIKQMKDDGFPIEPILEAMMIHAVALQANVDQKQGWLSSRGNERDCQEKPARVSGSSQAN